MKEKLGTVLGEWALVIALGFIALALLPVVF